MGPKLGQDVERKVRKLLSGTKLSSMATTGKVLLEISNNSQAVQGVSNKTVNPDNHKPDEPNNFVTSARSTHQVGGSSGL